MDACGSKESAAAPTYVDEDPTGPVNTVKQELGELDDKGDYIETADELKIRQDLKRKLEEKKSKKKKKKKKMRF